MLLEFVGRKHQVLFNELYTYTRHCQYIGCLYSLDWTTGMTSKLELYSFRESESRQNLTLYGHCFSDSEKRPVTGCRRSQGLEAKGGGMVVFFQGF